MSLCLRYRRKCTARKRKSQKYRSLIGHYKRAAVLKSIAGRRKCRWRGGAAVEAPGSGSARWNSGLAGLLYSGWPFLQRLLQCYATWRGSCSGLRDASEAGLGFLFILFNRFNAFYFTLFFLSFFFLPFVRAIIFLLHGRPSPPSETLAQHLSLLPANRQCRRYPSHCKLLPALPTIGTEPPAVGTPI